MVCVCSSYLGLPNKLSQDSVAPTAITNFAHKSSVWAGLGGAAHLCPMGVSGGLTRAGGPSSTMTHSLGWHIGACWGFHLKALPPFHMVLLSFPWGCLGFRTAWWLGVTPVFQEQGMKAARLLRAGPRNWHSITPLSYCSSSPSQMQGEVPQALSLSGKSFKDYLIYYSAGHSTVIYGENPTLSHVSWSKEEPCCLSSAPVPIWSV